VCGGVEGNQCHTADVQVRVFESAQELADALSQKRVDGLGLKHNKRSFQRVLDRIAQKRVVGLGLKHS